MNLKILRSLLVFASIFLFSSHHVNCQESYPWQSDVQWAVVGAGGAGIIVVGLLLDLGVKPEQIAWIDPEFNAGRLGKYYTNVPANVKAQTFVHFINSCKTFRECQSPSIIALHEYDQELEYPLQTIVDPLLDITKMLCARVICIQSTLTSLDFENDIWHVGHLQGTFTAAHVVLATGSHPRSLDYECNHEIPLDYALDKQALSKLVEPNDSIAVIGSSHSAVLVLKFLSELPVKRILNFYKHPLVYNKPEVGLLGIAATWAKETLENHPPIPNVLRIYNVPESRKAWLSICNKIIYAVGFDRNQVPPINGESEMTYDDKTGIIGSRLFGIGIAFPETFIDAETGNTVSKIGLLGFMNYAQRIMPEWLLTKEPLAKFCEFEELFSINIL